MKLAVGHPLAPGEEGCFAGLQHWCNALPGPVLTPTFAHLHVLKQWL